MSNKSTSKSKRNIPQEIKRILRQESGFGCCCCGIPILEYHHIRRWSIVKKHQSQHMMAVCPTCHSNIESYTEEQQYLFKNNPYNLKSQQKKNGYLIISQGICAVNTGDIKLIGDGPLLSSNGINFLEIYVNEINLLEISLNLFNEKGENILSIKKSEWIKGNVELWDIEFNSASKVLIIKEKEGVTNLKIDARSFPVLLEGSFWINGKLITFNKRGIHFGDHNTFLKSQTSQTEKWGIWHFDQDSFKYLLSENATLTGSDLLSGCIIDLSKDDEIYLIPKQTPYKINLEKGNFDNNERLLLQSISAIKYFNTNITINQDLSDFKPFARGIERLDSKLSAVFFEKKLARFYAIKGKVEKAIKKYQEIHKTYHEFYNKPNVEEGELLLEISKYLKNVGDNNHAKDYFIESFICFTHTGNFPYRLFDFGNNLFRDNDLCYCGSGNYYLNCHKYFSILKKESVPNERNIQIIELPNDKEFKITIYFLKEHKTHWSINIDEYSKGFQHIYSGQHKNSFSLNINSDLDIPAIIRLDCYGLLPIIKEFILTKDGYKIAF
jgi:hypothetical protein